MSDYSLDLNDDQQTLVDWVHTFAADVVRPAAEEWDEREEFPWPIVQEAANIGLYGWEFMAANLAGRTMIAIWDKTLYAMPLVRSIYKGSKQIFETLFSQKGASFRYVCLVEWPRRDAWSVAFVSREVDGGEIGLEHGRAMYAVYVSTTPNPTSGYVFFVDVDDVKILDMSVEDGLKLVISMGLVFPEQPLPPEKEAEAASLRTGA
jgi:uncharacterized membrane protein